MSEVRVGSKIEYPPDDTYVIVDVGARSQDWGKDLHPYRLGPVTVKGFTRDYRSSNLESAWKFSQVYDCHADPLGYPTPEYERWAINGFSRNGAYRYPMGIETPPVATVWDGKKLDPVDARKKVFFFFYRDLVVKTEAFKKLKSLYDAGNVYLKADDAYDIDEQGLTLDEAADDITKPYSHALVLKQILQEG